PGRVRSVPRRDEELAQHPGPLAQGIPLRRRGAVDAAAEPGVPPLPSGEHQLLSLLGERDPHLAPVDRVRGTPHQPGLFEPPQDPGHHRRADVLEVRQRARRRLPRPLEVGEHGELRGGDLLGGGVGTQDPRGDQQHALQLVGELDGLRVLLRRADSGLRRLLAGPVRAHSSRPSRAPRRKYATNSTAMRYISQCTSRALPRTIRMSTYITKPAPIPTVIEYANGMRMMVRKAGTAISTSVKSMSVIWVIIRKPTITSAVVAASYATIATSGDKKVDSRKSTPTTTAARPVRAPSATPEVDSTKLVFDETPPTPPAIAAAESTTRIRCECGMSPSSCTRPAPDATPTI